MCRVNETSWLNGRNVSRTKEDHSGASNRKPPVTKGEVSIVRRTGLGEISTGKQFDDPVEFILAE